MPVSIPPDRARAAQEIAAVLVSGRRVVLTTHVNADGDGVGSEIGLWHLLRARDVPATIANPTGIPERFDFLLPEAGGADASDHAVREIERADVIVVLDIGDLSRLGDLGHAVRQRAGGPGPPQRRGAADARGGAGSGARLGDRAARRARPPRRDARRPGRHRRVPTLDRRRPAGPVVPPDRERTHQGVVPLDGRGGRGGAGARVRRGRAPQGGGGVVRGSDGRGRGQGAGRRAGLPPESRRAAAGEAGSATTSETARVEAFSDGVFAIAITLLVLEIRVPEPEAAARAGGLVRALAALWPSYLGYLISFVTIGIMWANHHAIYQYIRRSDRYFLLINV